MWQVEQEMAKEMRRRMKNECKECIRHGTDDVKK